MFRERLRELCAQHHGTVRRVCWRYVQNSLDADDLAQETLLRAARAFGGFAGTASTTTWLHRIAVNRCLDHLRDRSRARAALYRFAREDAVIQSIREEPDAVYGAYGEHGVPGAYGASVVSSGDTDEDARCARSRALLEALHAELEDVDRVVARLCFEEGLSQREAAQRLQVSRGAVEKRLARVRSRALRIRDQLTGPGS